MEMVPFDEDNTSLEDPLIPKSIVCCKFLNTGFKEQLSGSIDVVSLDPNQTSEQIFHSL